YSHHLLTKLFSFVFSLSAEHLELHPFPTRRSSDLRVVRYPYRSGAVKAAGPPETIVGNIPTQRHWTRDLVVSADGKRLFLAVGRSEEHTSELQSRENLVCRLLLEKKNNHIIRLSMT